MNIIYKTILGIDNIQPRLELKKEIGLINIRNLYILQLKIKMDSLQILNQNILTLNQKMKLTELFILMMKYGIHININLKIDLKYSV
jgi:hypothetical protein